MVIAVVVAVIEFAACCWLGFLQVRLCNLVERQQLRLRRVTAELKAARKELERAKEKLYIAETERDFYKAENEKPSLKDSVKSVEVDDA